MTQHYKTIIVEQDGEVDWLTLNRPDALNALNPQMTEELYHYFTALYHDHSRRIVVMKANGRAFCAGLDMVEYDAADASPQSGFRTQVSIGDVIKLSRDVHSPLLP